MIKKILVVFVIFTLLFSCKSLSNFENEYQGQQLSKPIDVGKLKAAVRLGLLNYDWKTLSEENGKIIAKYEKSHGSISATIEVDYSQDGYTIKYIDSKNLNVNLKKMKIHPNYVRWIRNLDKTIAKNYYAATM